MPCALCSPAWFSCARELIRRTAPADIWSTPLYDREPMQPRPPRQSQSQGQRKGKGKGKGQGQGQGQGGGRVTVLGDACHPMSMFKGRDHCSATLAGCDWLLDDGMVGVNELC